MSWGLPTNEKPGKHPFFIKNISYRYSSYGVKNMSKRITSPKFNEGPKAYRLKREKMPVIPFLSLSSGGRSRRRKRQKERLGELWVAEDTKRTSWWPSKGRLVKAAPGEELEDEAAGCQYAMKASVRAYSDLTALPPALFLFRSFPTPAAQGDDPEKFREPATRMMGSPVPPGATPGTLVVVAVVFLATLA